MDGFRGNGLRPRPKSPPEYPDLYGKRRELAKIQMLEREISFLEEELKSADELPPASRCCKEVADFATSNLDPLIPITKEIRISQRFKWLCGVSCFNVSSGVCTPDLDTPRCSRYFCDGLCFSRRAPKFDCNLFWIRGFSRKLICCWNCCVPKFPSCLTCSNKCTNPKCLELNSCSCCCRNCCYPCYLCY